MAHLLNARAGQDTQGAANRAYEHVPMSAHAAKQDSQSTIL